MKKNAKALIDKLRSEIRDLHAKREESKELATSAKNAQPQIIAMMQEFGVNNEVGIVIDPNDKHKGTAYVQQNQPSLVWKTEEIMDWLDKKVVGRPQLRKKTQSLVFDINKWEALVTSKEVPPKVAKRFQTQAEPPAPFIRFGKEGDKSL